MRHTHHNDVVHTFAPDRSDQTFGKAIPPRRGWRGQLVPDSHGAHSASGNTSSSNYVSDFLATADGVALAKAFMKIKEAKTRHRIVRLVFTKIINAYVVIMETAQDWS